MGAATGFTAALALCPAHRGAAVGMGYVDMRARFLAVVADAPAELDALVGLGLLAWRAGNLEEVSGRFLRVQEVDSANATAAEYLALLPAGLGPPPERPPLILPDTVELVARVAGERFEVRRATGWSPF